MIRELVIRARGWRWAHLAVVNLRILIGFAFVPAGLKKVLGERFTDLDNVGAFHAFLHAFYDTGVFYRFVGVVQLVIAGLLMTQTFATLGALMALPVITTIMVFCWSTGVYPTATVTTLMWAGTVGLVLWDVDRWRGVLAPLGRDGDAPPRSAETGSLGGAGAGSGRGLVDLHLWRGCGLGILGVYALITALSGGVYRPRGVALDEPGFYLMPVIALFPFATLALETMRRRAARRKPGP